MNIKIDTINWRILGKLILDSSHNISELVLSIWNCTHTTYKETMFDSKLIILLVACMVQVRVNMISWMILFFFFYETIIKNVYTPFNTQDVAWTSIQRLLNVMNVRWTSKHRCVLYSNPTNIRRYFDVDLTSKHFNVMDVKWTLKQRFLSVKHNFATLFKGGSRDSCSYISLWWSVNY